MNIQSIFKETFDLLQQRFWKFFAIALPLVIFSLVFLPFSNGLLAEHSPKTTHLYPLFLLGWLINIALYLIVAVKCHQVFLWDARVNVKDYFTLDSEHLNFVFAIVKVSLAYMLIFTPMILLWEKVSRDHWLGIENPELVIHLLTLLTSIVFSRIALILPAAAVEERMSVRRSWRLTGQNKLTVFVLFALIPLLTTWLLEFIPTETNRLLESLEILLWLMVSLWELGLLSVYYGHARKNDKQVSELL